MTKQARRFEIYLEDGADGIEHLTIAHLVNMRGEAHADASREQLVALACRIYDTRRERAKFFNNALLGEPVWDMLLALFCLPKRNQRLSASGLCHASGVPTSTALRWLHVIEQKGLVQRHPDEKDARRVWLSLTDKGDELLANYFSKIYHIMIP